MNEDKSPEPQNNSEQDTQIQKSGSGSKGLSIALLAGVLGLAVGAGLYAFSGSDDNGENAVAGLDGGTCAVDQALRTKLDTVAGGDVAAFKALDRPFSVASFAFNNKAGEAKTLGDWEGKTVLFNLWATWCAPCRAEMPALDALNKDLGGDKFEVIPVSVDLGEPDKPQKFYTDIGLKSVGFFHDPELATLNTLKKNGLAFGLPATLLVNGKGCVLGTLNGPAEWAGEDAKKLIQTAL